MAGVTAFAASFGRFFMVLRKIAARLVAIPFMGAAMLGAAGVTALLAGF